VEVFDGSLPTGITFGGFANDEVTFTGQATETGEFTFTLRAYASDPTAGAAVFTDRQVSVTVSAVSPGPPTSISVFDRSGDTIVSLTPPTAPGSDTVFYEGTVNGGSNWTTLVADGGNWRFPDFDRSAQQAVQVRARNQAGSSDATSPVTFPQFMLNNGSFRIGGDVDNPATDLPHPSIGQNGQVVQPFYYDDDRERWAKMTHGSSPFDFALGFGTGNEPSIEARYSPAKNWTGATVYGTFQTPDPFASPTAGSTSVTQENFVCDFASNSPVCVGTGTIVSAADFELGEQGETARTVRVINRYTLQPDGNFLEVVTTVENTDGSPLENVNVWVGTRDDYVGISTTGGDETNSADFPLKKRGTIDTADGSFTPLAERTDRATALVIESTDGAGLFFSTSPDVNTIIAPCCNSLDELASADEGDSSLQSHSHRGFENAVTLSPFSSGIETPLKTVDFEQGGVAEDFQEGNRRADLRDAGYALHLPLGTLPAGESNSATWFLGGVPLSNKDSLFDAVVEAAPVAAQASVGRGTLTVDLEAVPTDANTIGFEIRLQDGNGSIVETVQVFGSPTEYIFTTVANGKNYQVDVAPLSGTESTPVVGDRTLLSGTLSPLPPDNLTLPTISGIVAPGSTLEATTGEWEWDGAELSTLFQWQRDGVDISGATANAFTMPTNVGSGAFTVIVTRQASGGVAVAATSAPVGFDPEANLIVEENFSANLGNSWVLTGEARVSDGTLQLTPAENSKAGAAFYTIPQQTTGGIDATFTINQRGGTGADGMTFFLKDGDDTSTTPGPAGSRLGFNAGGSTPGISGALIGVGFDRFGGFIRADRIVQKGNFTCPQLGGTDQQGGNQTLSNNLTLRGPGQGLEGYCKLVEGVQQRPETDWQDSEKTIRFRYDPSGSSSLQIRIWVDDISDSDTPLISTSAPQELLDVETFKFGFTASTGGSTNIHEVKTLRVEAATFLAPLEEIAEASLPVAVVNQPYFVDLSTLVRGGVRPFTFGVSDGALPPGLTLSSPLRGTVTEPGLYEFSIQGSDSRPGPLQSTIQIPFSLQVNAPQTITFPTPSARQLQAGAINAGASTSLESSVPTVGLPPTYSASTPSICDVSSGGNITVSARGECRITASQAGGARDGFDILPAADVERAFTVYDAHLSGLAISSGTLSPAFSSPASQYQIAVPHDSSTITLTPTSRFSGADITVGGAPVISGVASAPVPLTVGQNTVVVTVSDGDFSNTTTLTITRAAAAAPPATNQSTNQQPRPPVSEALAPAIPGVVVIPRPAATSPALTAPRPPIAQGPVVTGNQAPRPSNQPTATIGGVPTPISQSPIGTTGVRVTTGSIDVGVRVNSTQQGAVRNTPQGTPELSVVKGQQTVISGSGMAPGSTVQAFLPLSGSNAIELGRIQADATGAFNGAAVLNTPLTQAPLPVGRQVLQILGVDNAGNQTVVNMTINIAQPPPQPEINRENQEVPALAVGQSLATEAGIPVPVTVTPIPENNQTLIEGAGWTMGVSVGGEGAEVGQTENGDVVLTLVRDETASVSGSGFMPFTRADIWLFSDPTLLGTVEIDENGEFKGVVNVDGNVVAAGEHTLQIQGTGEDGYVRAANLGVLVGESSDALPAPTASASVSWLLWVLGIFGVLALIAAAWWLRRLQTARQ
jgi:hypothetical protein